eukprot:6174998-Pleurochrysis_carterae.AAC.4
MSASSTTSHTGCRSRTALFKVRMHSIQAVPRGDGNRVKLGQNADHDGGDGALRSMHDSAMGFAKVGTVTNAKRRPNARVEANS